MEYTFDSEDMATFYRSLLLLHSPKIDSQRKLYHIMNQSIRKHHPSRKIPHGKKNSEIPTAEASDFKTPVGEKEISSDLTSDETEANQQDPRVEKEQNTTKSIDLSPQTSNDSKVQAESIKSEPKSYGSKCVKQSTGTSEASVMNFSLGLKNYSTSQPSDVSPQKNPRVSHLAGRESPFLKPMPKASPKTSGRHHYCPNPVNLKKIRAVLARGDPFPTHLTKACVNNITPDLQREKL